MEVLESMPLFKGVVKRAVVKVGTLKEEKLQIIPAEDFFKRLCDLQLRKGNNSLSSL